jgi:hypothetical protein
VLQERARLVAVEQRRLADLKGTVTVEEALGFARALLAAVREVVKDQALLHAVNERLVKLLPPPEER